MLMIGVKIWMKIELRECVGNGGGWGGELS